MQPCKTGSYGRNRGVCKTHSIHVPLLAALHVFSHGVSLFLADLKSFPQLHDTATEGHAHRLDLRFPILQLNPKHGTIINRARLRLQRREQNSQCSQKQSRLIYRLEFCSSASHTLLRRTNKGGVKKCVGDKD